MTIGTKIIKGALRKIQVHTLNSPASPEDIENSVDTLNSMLEMWTSKGIELGILPLESSGNELGEPPDTTNAIKSNLALYLADDYEDGQAVVSKTLRDNARRDFEDLQTIGYRNLNIPGKVPSDTLLTGQGNKRWWDSYRTFFGPGTTLGGESGAAGLGGGGGIGGGIPGPPGPPGPQGPPGDEVFASAAEAIAGTVTDKSIAPDTLHDTLKSPPIIGEILPAVELKAGGVRLVELESDPFIAPIKADKILSIQSTNFRPLNLNSVLWPFGVPSLGQVPQITDGSGSVNWENPHEILNLIGTGDLVFNSSVDILTRLAIGNSNQFLGINSGLPAWRTLPPSAHRNFIIDGDFSQVTPNITGVTDNVYATKLFRFLKGTSTAVHDINRLTTGGPTIAQASHRASAILEVKVTTAEASVPSAGRTTLKYTVTGSDYSPFPLQPVALDFWVKCSITGLFSVGFQNNLEDRSLVNVFSISAADTWERKTITFVADAASGWSFGDSDSGIEIYINLVAGADFQSSVVDTWAPNDLTSFFLDDNNFNKTVGNVFQITMAGIYEGDAPGKFVDEDVQTVKRRTAWYVREWNLNTVADESSGLQGRALSATQAEITLNYGIEMRIAPPASRINFSGANTWEVQHGFSSGESITGFGTPEVFIGKNSCAVVANVAANLTLGQSVSLNRNGSATATLIIDARHYD